MALLSFVSFAYYVRLVASIEFETVNRIFELCFQMSKRSRDSSHDTMSLSVPASGSAADSAPGDSNLKSESAIVDKLTLIKSYELTLKN